MSVRLDETVGRQGKRRIFADIVTYHASIRYGPLSTTNVVK